MISISKTYSFSAAHHLPNHNGKCRNPHGHNYRVEIEVASGNDSNARPGNTDHDYLVAYGEEQSDEGMLMDFGDLDEIVEPAITRLDHHDLNEIFGNNAGRFFPPTAENLSLYFKFFVETKLKGDYPTRPSLKLERVTIWETDKCSATWRRDR